jgi:cbb3-type cytochrome oxidase maturation protein
VDVTFYLFFTALLVSFAAWCVFLWAVRTGQFRDIEDVKYQVWPGKSTEGAVETRGESGPPPEAPPPGP